MGNQIGGKSGNQSCMEENNTMQERGGTWTHRSKNLEQSIIGQISSKEPPSCQGSLKMVDEA